MTYEFIYEFMYMKNFVKSYLNSGVSRFQMGVLYLDFYRSRDPYPHTGLGESG